MTHYALMLGWIVGIGSMGMLSSVGLSNIVWGLLGFNVLSILCIRLFAQKNYRKELTLRWRVLLRICYMSAAILLGYGYAEHALEQHLALRSADAEHVEAIIYVDQIAENAQANPQRWQHQVLVLKPSSPPIRWRLSYFNQPDQAQGSLHLGQYYRVNGQVKAAQSYAVSGAFDLERWFVQQHLMGSMQLQSFQLLSHTQVDALGLREHRLEQQGLWIQSLLAVQRMRLYLRNNIQAQNYAEQGLMLALLTGDRSLLSHETQQQFQRLGISHLLAISGPHVLIMAIMLCWLAAVMINRCWPSLYLRCSRVQLLLLPFFCCVVFYSALVGFEIPAVRTLISVGLLCLGRLLHIAISPLKLVLFSACIMLLWDPLSILSAAFYLSYVACFIMLLLYQHNQQSAQPKHSALSRQSTVSAHQLPLSATKRWIEQQNKWTTQDMWLNKWLELGFKRVPSFQRFCQHVVMLAQPLIKQTAQGFYLLGRLQLQIFIALLPISVLIFQKVSYLAVLSNLIAVPMISVFIVPVLILAALCSLLVAAAAQPLYWLAHQIIDLLLRLLGVLDRLPFNPVQWWAITPLQWCCITLAIMLCMLPKELCPRLWRGVLLAAALFYQAPQQHVELTVLDVGQGQAIFLHTPERQIMIDVGGSPVQSHQNIAEQVLIPYLMQQGIKQLDQVILSHLDLDHSGAFAALTDVIQVKALYSSEYDAQFKAQNFDYCRAGQQWQDAQVSIQILSPRSDQLASAPQLRNERSCVVYVQVKGHDRTQHFLIMGDAGWETEFELLQRYPNLKVDVLIVGHHGSRHSSAYEFLAHYVPSYAVASEGRHNRYGHPSLQVQRRLAELEIALLRTSQLGSIRFQVDEQGQLSHTTQRQRRRWLRS